MTKLETLKTIRSQVEVLRHRLNYSLKCTAVLRQELDAAEHAYSVFLARGLFRLIKGGGAAATPSTARLRVVPSEPADRE